MKRYSEKTNDWMKNKALGFFINFINNHNGSIDNNDTFALVSELIPHAEWLIQISDFFPEGKLSRLQKNKMLRDRLNFEEEPKEFLRELWTDASSRKQLRMLFGSVVANHLKKKARKRCASESFPKKLNELQKTLGLSDFEVDVLLVLAFAGNDTLPIASGHNRSPDERDKVIFISKCLDCDQQAVLVAVSDKNKLRRYDCIDNDLDFNQQLNGFLNGIVSEPLANSYFQRNKTDVLPWNFYGSLAKEHGEILKSMIRSTHGCSGVNILLYGAPGTGKTSFAKTLAAELGLGCFCIAQSCSNRFGISGTTEFRFGALQICDAQIEPSRSLIIVDEADEMLRCCGDGLFCLPGGQGSASAGDKGMLNSVLDTIRTPTVWITNTESRELDESSRRRFDYSIRFDPLDRNQRLSIWKNNVSKMKLGKMFDESMLQKFAERYAVSAGGISLVVKNVAKLNPRKDEVAHLVEQLMKPHCELLNIPDANNKFCPAQDYSLDGLNITGDVRLDRITAAIRNFQTNSGGMDCPRMNLLLFGAPGTGKTEFVKYLGKTLNTKVHIAMGSDLLDMYVGGTEKNIRQAFARAESEKAILFLDEIDGLVQSRERAQRNWEVTQVNELLYQMENFKGVMLGATNFAANLDGAILRRFTFKLEFNYLDNSGKVLFFERMFRTKLNQSEKQQLANIPNLAPGDFRTVRQSLFYLEGSITNSERLSALERESLAKGKNRFAAKSKMGF